MSTPSCPTCGETPMFRTQVHDCCVELERLTGGHLSLRDALLLVLLTLLSLSFALVALITHDTFLLVWGCFLAIGAHSQELRCADSRRR